MTYEPQLEWCRENIPHFKDFHDAAEQARKETEENRKRMASLMSKPSANAGVK